MSYVAKRCEDIVVGDAIFFEGCERRVAEITPNEGPLEFVLGYAWSADGWSIALEEDQILEVAA